MIRPRPLAVFTLALIAVAIALTAAAPASAQAVDDAGGSAAGTGTFDFDGPSTLRLEVTGTPEAAAGLVELALASDPVSYTYTGEARCIAIDETLTGFRASIAGQIIGGPSFLLGNRGFQLTVYDNTPSGEADRFGGDATVSTTVQTDCGFDFEPGPPVETGDYVITPAGACPPGEDEDGDGLNDSRERLFSTLLGNSDSDRDGIKDGNDDANGNGEDDEDEDDDECPDEDSDGDGEDDEDEDDDDDD